MMSRRLRRLLLIYCVFTARFIYLCTSTEVCTNTLLPGAKGDQGESGDDGEQGKMGKTGPPGPLGVAGETGLVGDIGHTGKMGPIGHKGEKGDSGLVGPSGLKGKPGTSCDCGRYRKLVGQIDVNVSKLRNAVKFVKYVILGLRETEERYYLLVKEPRRYSEALMSCKLRGGTLAMPKTRDTNLLLADCVRQTGLTAIYIGLQAHEKTPDGERAYVFADANPLRGFASWGREELSASPSPPIPTNSSCVELLNTGTWAPVQCDTALFYICEFPKSRRRGGAVREGGGGTGGGGTGGGGAPVWSWS